MLRERVRPRWSDEQLAAIYRQPFNHHALGDGSTPRVALSSWIGRTLPLAVDGPPIDRVADLSCGNGAIARGCQANHVILGDYAPGHQIVGPIEETILTLDPVDLFVCCETLEHLWEPDVVLREARARSRFLVTSVPLWERAEQEQNGEHYWAFDRAGFESLLGDTGWTPVLFAEVPGYPTGGDGGFYQTGVWGCS